MAWYMTACLALALQGLEPHTACPATQKGATRQIELYKKSSEVPTDLSASRHGAARGSDASHGNTQVAGRNMVCQDSTRINGVSAPRKKQLPTGLSMMCPLLKDCGAKAAGDSSHRKFPAHDIAVRTASTNYVQVEHSSKYHGLLTLL